MEKAWQQDRADGTPDEIFRRTLAVELVNQGIAALRLHYARRSPVLVEDLLPALEGPLPDDSCADIGKRHGMTATAVAVAVSRMRLRFETEVRKSASALLGIPQGPVLDAELRDLFCGPATRLSP